MIILWLCFCVLSLILSACAVFKYTANHYTTNLDLIFYLTISLLISFLPLVNIFVIIAALSILKDIDVIEWLDQPTFNQKEEIKMENYYDRQRIK